MKGLVKPHGGKLVDRRLRGEELEQALEEVRSLKRIFPGLDVLMDAEKIAIGAFSPLEGFMSHRELKEVLETMHLPNGLVWSLPILFQVDDDTAIPIKEGERVGLWYDDQTPIAVMEVEEKFRLDKEWVAVKTFGTADEAHPGVARLLQGGDWALAGKILLLNPVPHPWREFELTPEETREAFQKRGWSTVVAFQTRNAPHRAHEYLQRVALEIADGLFVQPILGSKKPGDFDNETILKAYRALIDHYFPENRVFLGGLSTPMRYAGPKEAVFHAIVRKNYGASHFMVGRDHAGVGNYYDPFAAQQIFEEFEDGEIGVQIIKFGYVFYCYACGGMASDKTCGHTDDQRLKISMTKVREMLKRGETPPPEMVRPEVAEVLREFFRRQPG